METKAVYFSSLLLIGTACWMGHLRQQSKSSEVFLAARATPQLDYLEAPESFSRVENTKNTLEALCWHLRLQDQTRFINAKHISSSQLSEKTRQLDSLVQNLQSSMKEFAGTDQELEMAQDLLNVFKSEGRYKDWLDLYLQALYERPTHSLISRYATDAVLIGKETNRDQEILTGLRHLAAIPMNFAGKDRILVALTQARSGMVATRFDVVDHPSERGS